MRNWVYQVFIQQSTNECYRGSLHYVPNGSRLLDVGIGTGIMIETFHPLIRFKKLRITGIDIDAGYLQHCQELIRKHQLEDCIDVCRASAEGYAPAEQGCFDGILFCMSFMLLRDPHAVLQRVKDWLKPDGQVVFAQTIFKKKSRLVDLAKPKLKYLTGVEFGTPIYEKDFFALLREHGLLVQADQVLTGGWFHSQCRLIAASFGPQGQTSHAAAGSFGFASR